MLMGLSFTLEVGGRAGAASAPAPTLSSLNYSQGDPLGGGEDIVITGAGFTGVTGAGGVTFLGTNATSYVVDSDTQITATLPAHAAAAGDVVVTHPTNGASNALSFEYWDPLQDAAVTLLYDAISDPYNAGTGEWVPRYTAAAGSKFTTPLGTATPASNGGPLFDGDGATQGQLIDASGKTWNDFLGAVVGSGRPGSWGGVYSATGNTIYNSPAPHQHQLCLGSVDANSGVIGLGHAQDGVSSIHYAVAHTYVTTTGGTIDLSVDGGLPADLGTKYDSLPLSTFGYQAPKVPASDGVLHAVVCRAETVASAYTNYRMSSGTKYADSNIANQNFAGNILSLFAANARVADTFFTKHYAWAKQRFGVA